LENLQIKEKEIIVIVKDFLPGVEIYESDWVKEENSIFTKIYENNTVQIYQINQ